MNVVSRKVRVPKDRAPDGAEPVSDASRGGVTLRVNDAVLAWLTERRIFLGRVHDGSRKLKTLTIPGRAAIEPYACFPEGDRLFEMGAFSYSETPFRDSVRIGRYCSIATKVRIMQHRHPVEWVTTSSITYDISPTRGYASFVAAQADFNGGVFDRTKPPRLMGPGPTIEHDVWIGEGALIARGIRIGTGAIVAAGAVVTKDVEPYTIVGGVPARVVKRRFDEALSTRLLATRWWDYGPDIFRDAGHRDPERFVAFLEEHGAGVPSLELVPVTAQEAIGRFGVGD